jgi:hypothetical protein
MTDSYDLTQLGTEAFENIVNFLALKTLGLGNTGFGPGADGGRDGYFEGEAPYPSKSKQWKGTWIIQSKFHKPHLSKNPQKWLVEQVANEIKKFETDESDRSWPDNWIIATNIDPSGKPKTGSFDKIKGLLEDSNIGKKVNLAVWGGRRILDMLALHDEIANYYGHLLTPGHVISALYSELSESRASVKDITHYFIATQFTYHTFSKLDQAGSSSDDRPGVHDLFIDLPFISDLGEQEGLLKELCKTSAQCHRYSLRIQTPELWRKWSRRSKRARVILVKGGPGQGKSTIGQYFCQIHRAALILADDGPNVINATKDTAKEVRMAAQEDEFWPATPRIPVQIELKEFAHWYSQRQSDQPKDVLNYLSETISKKIGHSVLSKTLKSAFSKTSWFIVFDGLDEVPNDSKGDIAEEVLYFLNDVIVEIDGDVLALCTSRPQGYSGQFSGLDGPEIELSQLDSNTAMRCAKPLLKFGRNPDDADKSIKILEAAILSPNVKELMTTPLQSHIMAVVIRDGGRPPERRWQLFNSFYLVMKKRESLKDFKNPRIAKLLREDDLLLKSVHMRLGFVLHAQAEQSAGAQTTLSKNKFKSLVNDVVTELVENEISETVEDVMEATTERLVLVSTPEDGEQVRFDIRQLQEFFAAEYLYTGVDPIELGCRIAIIGGDEHWREVMHFLMSALIENQRTSDVAVAVQELRKLNEGTEPDNLYYRRTATAVLLASRLLVEGVLEQDQRVRQRIKPLLDPLGGKFNLDSLRGLRDVKPTNSRTWLIQLLLEKLTTANSHEYVGALYLLGWLLPDNHSESERVTNAFFRTSIQFQENLARLWGTENVENEFLFPRRFSKKNRNLSQWVIRLAFNILNSADWVKYSPTTIHHFLVIVFGSTENFSSISKLTGLDVEVTNALEKSWHKETIVPTNQNSDTSHDYGLLSVICFKENWQNSAIPEQLKEIDADSCLKVLDGFFRLMLLCVSYGKKHDDGVLLKIISAFDIAGVNRICVLPQFLLALLPIPGAYDLKAYNIEHLRCVDSSTCDKGVSLARAKGILPPIEDLLLQSKDNPTRQNWSAIVSRLPTIIPNLIFHLHSGRISLPGEETKPSLDVFSFPEIRSALKNSPDRVCKKIGSWGILCDSHSDLLNELKESVKILSRDTRADVGNFIHNLHPFTLELPMDAPLLPLIAQTLATSVNKYGLKQRTESDPSIKDSIFAYGLSVDQLKAIAESKDYDQSSRSGALAIYWLSLSETSSEGTDKTNLDITKEQALYTELVDEINEKWLTEALIRGVLIDLKDTDARAIKFASYLIKRCNEGGGPQDEVKELLNVWQERSAAPVNSHDVLNKWLNYNFESTL